MQELMQMVLITHKISLILFILQNLSLLHAMK